MRYIEKHQDELQKSLNYISHDILSHLQNLGKLVSGYSDETESLPDDFIYYQNDLKQLSALLKQNILLLCTMLETNSNDILHYVQHTTLLDETSVQG